MTHASHRPQLTDLPPVIAVDGGGTRCRMVLDMGANDGPNGAPPRHEVIGGSVNVNTDFDGAVAELLRCLDQLALTSGVARATLIATPTYLGLAGIIGPALIPKVQAALPFTQVKIEDDQPAAVKGVLGEADGLVAHCGTGSFIAEQKAGNIRLVGGWGHVLGDAASAMWIGRLALSRSLDVVDGLRPPSTLANHLVTQFGDAPGIVDFAASASPADFGQLARSVTNHAAKGDPLAREVMQAGADALADTLSRLGWRPGTGICLTGGIGPEFAPFLSADMQQDLTTAKGTPIYGAVSLARAFAREASV